MRFRWLRSGLSPPSGLLAALIVAFSFASSSTLRAESQSDRVGLVQQELAADYDRWFRQQAEDERVVGAAFAIVSRDHIVRVGTHGYTDTTRKRQVDGDTAFRLASVSKTFAAGLAAQLVDEGRFRWDDPITDYVPDFRIRGETSRIHVEHLLGQSSGLVPHAYDNLLEDGVSIPQIRARFAELAPTCEPGSCYSYQNTLFSLIETVVERTAADSYANLVDQRIFRPLDMRTASVGYEAFLATRNRALPHVKRNGRWRTVPVLPNYYRVAPAAGINASVLDLAKWLMAQLGTAPEVLRPAVVDTLITPRVRTPRDLRRKEWKRLLADAHYGLGWRVYQIGDERIAYHSGWVSGYRADIAWSPEHGLGLAVLMNVEGSVISTMSTHFWEMAFARLHSPPPTTSP
ncbi:serine hydrolase domain-containing protein [Elongatibacter sediminis]|uniref:Serine hydrolase domain-containing protein n=1 Tax=Elongatibacter sediminis TaxID=3119006 RepID=A0AAW9RE83_9GAMM